MTDFEITRGAERPSLVWAFTSAGQPYDLTGNTSVAFQARPYDGTAAVISGAGSVMGTATGGSVAYSFGTADTQNVGELRGRFIVSFPAGELVSPEFVVRIVDAAPARGVPGGRSTMAALVERVRFLMDDPGGPGQKFTDAEVQDALDRNREDVYGWEARPIPQVLGGGTTQWLTYDLGGTDWEDGVILRDGAGGTPSGYTVDLVRGIASFPANTHGTIYYATGSAYDPPSAAADLLEKLISRYAMSYDVSMDGQSFSRSQIVMQLQRRVQTLRSQGRVRSARLFRSDYPGADPRAYS